MTTPARIHVRVVAKRTFHLLARKKLKITYGRVVLAADYACGPMAIFSRHAVAMLVMDRILGQIVAAVSQRQGHMDMTEKSLTVRLAITREGVPIVAIQSVVLMAVVIIGACVLLLIMVHANVARIIRVSFVSISNAIYPLNAYVLHVIDVQRRNTVNFA